VLAEFAGDPRTLRLIVADTQGHRRTFTLDELLPEAFTPEQLPRK
jgi:cytidine deaminase